MENTAKEIKGGETKKCCPSILSKFRSVSYVIMFNVVMAKRAQLFALQNNSLVDQNNEGHPRDASTPFPSLPKTVEGDNNSNNNGEESNHKKQRSSNQKVTLEWVFVVANFIAELLSMVFDQISSKQNPQVALLCMLVSLSTVVICILELIYKGRKERVVWKWNRAFNLPWFYHPTVVPSDHRMPFGNFADFVGLVCGVCQFIVTTIKYGYYVRHVDTPVKICTWPLIFAFGLLWAKLYDQKKKGGHELASLSV